MKVLVIQNTVFENIDDTLTSITNELESISDNNVDFIVLPEMFFTPYELKYISDYRQTKSSKVITFLGDLAKKHSTYLIGGSLPFDDNGKIFNTTFVFNRQGDIIGRYDKIHLFEIEYPNGKTFSEAKILSPGLKILTFPTEFGPMGVEICFDIRFPQLSEIIENEGAKVIFVPAAFNSYTGPLHWQTTFRARAIDNQLFMIACSPSQNSFGDYEYYGHSLVVDPYGKIINEMDRKSGHIIVDIDLDKIALARKAIPIIKNKKDLKNLKGETK